MSKNDTLSVTEEREELRQQLATLHAEHATLQEREQHYRTILEATYDWKYWIDQHNHLHYTTPSCERITGYTMEELYQDNDLLWRMVHPDDVTRVALYHEQQQQNYQHHTIELRINTKNGNVQWLEHACQPVFDDANNWMGSIISNHTITEQKWTEDMLRLQRLLALSLSTTTSVDSALSNVMTYALKISAIDSGCIYHINPTSGDVNLICHQGISELFIENVSSLAADSLYARIIKRGQPIYYSQHNIIHMPQELVYGESFHSMAIIPIHYEQQIIAAMMVASHHHDEIALKARIAIETIASQIGHVIARLEAIAIMQEHRNNLQIMFDTLDDFVFIIDVRGAILQWNPIVERELGYSAAELPHHTITELYHPHCHAKITTILQEMLVGTVTLGIIDILSKAGKRISVETRAASITWNRTPTILIIAHDVMEQIQSQVMLRHSYEQLEERVQERTHTLEETNKRLVHEIAERMQIEEALRHSENLYREVTKLISDSVYSVNVKEDGTYIIDWGFEEFARITGYTTDELQLNYWQTIVHPEDQHIVDQRNKYFQAGQPIENEYRIITKHGDIRWIRDYGRPVWDDTQQRLIRIYGAVQDVTVYKHAGAALRESEQRFRQLTENIQQVFWMHDSITGRLLYISPAYEYIWQRTRESLYANPSTLQVCIHADDQSRMQLAWHNYFQGKRIDEEYRIVLTDGSTRWIWMRNFFIRNQNGDIYRYAGIAEDVTIRKRADESLRKREETYRAMFEKNTAIKMLLDPTTGDIVDANSAACAYYGYPAETLRKMNLADISNASVEQIRDELHIAASEQRQYFTGEHLLARGEIRAVNLYISLVDMHDRRLLYTIIFDVTEQQQAAARQKTQLTVTRTLADATTVAETIPRLLELICQGLGWQCSEWWQYADDAQSIACYYEWHIPTLHHSAFIQHRATHYTINHQMACITNTTNNVWHFADIERPHDLATIPSFIRIDDAKASGLHCCIAFAISTTKTINGLLCFYGNTICSHDHNLYDMMTDIGMQINQFLNRKNIEATLHEERALLAQRVEERTAELSIANAEMARAVRIKDEFLATMSHELRTPLNAVLGLTESLMEYTYGNLNERQLHTLQTIETSGRHLLSLINDILDLSKIEAGKMDIHIDRMTIDTVCQVSIQFVKQMALKKDITVNLAIDVPMKSIDADVRRLKQILVNLLSNAVKFTKTHGSVGLDVSYDEQHDRIAFAVWDTGIGIASDDMAKLFKPFEQIDNSLSRQHEGTGLGLALVLRLTEMHGGSVHVESTLGTGSRFTILLPVHNTLGQLADQPTMPAPAITTNAAAATTTVVAKEKPTLALLHHTTTYHDNNAQALVLIVDDNETTLLMLKDYLTQQGYRIVLARSGSEAIEQAKELLPNLIIMDIQMPGMDGIQAIQHIRGNEHLAHVPIIALTALAMPGDAARCLAAGATAYMSKPVKLTVLANSIATHIASL